MEFKFNFYEPQLLLFQLVSTKVKTNIILSLIIFA